MTLPGEGSQAEPDGPGMGQARDGRLGMLLSGPDNRLSRGAVEPALQKRLQHKLRRI